MRYMGVGEEAEDKGLEGTACGCAADLQVCAVTAVKVCEENWEEDLLARPVLLARKNSCLNPSCKP
jgi:hypothetical protein